MTLRRLLIALTSFVLVSAPAFAMQPPKGQSEFVPVDSLPRGRSTAGGAAARDRLCVCLDCGGGLPVVDLAASEQGRRRHARAGAEVAAPVTAGHFIFIPSVMLIGVIIGWVLGSRAARDAFANELKRRDERAARKSAADR